MQKLLFIPLLFLAAFALLIPTSQPARANSQAGPLRVQVVTPTATITPTVAVTVTVVVTVTATPTVTPQVTETPTPTPSPTAPVTVIPLPPGAPLILADIEAEFYVLWEQLGPLQLQYYFTHGRPWQGLITHSVIPADGTATTADRLLLHPTDVQENWLDFVPSVPLSMPYAVRLDVYEGEGGRGFVGRLFVFVDGDLWSRALDYGSGQWEEEWHVTELLP